ncbi:lactate utilization protein B [Pedobacter sp. SYP-B3415]|uniref:lactate utilization protein B n=1 Tax=Pedobacter sp. SYP-B3415 TaxID=2496641 RepID=UPI00101BFB07|nr:lactate utilization protein B [Pedobacter sp. SYP-B3415]
MGNTAYKDHAALSAGFNRDEGRVDWHDQTLWFVRQKRDRLSQGIPDWEDLREAASAIKSHTLSNIDTYLETFEKNALANGIHIHWAPDAVSHNQTVLEILQRHNISQLVKSKSMLTEECHLNDFLEQRGLEVTDTDLGERIVQLAKEPPSHIVLPCIHKKKEEIGELFHVHLGTPAGLADPQQLTEAARQDLRKRFLTRRAALTGVNFAIAETGEFVVCTNEGNADMGAHLADVHIASMGFEKVIPGRKELGIFLRLLARSATGQPITTYSSHFARPRDGQELHLILVDNGRSRQLGRDDFRASLKCIRCGACMNTCPVYRRSGGHSYHTAVAGPIGSILAPNLDMAQFKDLPFASTLCGSCSNVCPVKINIHEQLYKWRQVLVRHGHTDTKKTAAMKAMAYTLSRPALLNFAGKSLRFALRYAPLAINNPLNPWYRQRDMPAAPAETFAAWYHKNRKGANR